MKEHTEENRFLELLNEEISGLNERFLKQISGKAHPLIFIIGAPRSGTTFLSQLLLNNFTLAYPTNLIARFWKAPHLGYMIQRQSGFRRQINWTSNIGYTPGLDGLHEFGYFFRQLEDDQNHQVENILDQLRSLTQLSHSPWLFKNLYYVHPNIKRIKNSLEPVLFIYIKRNLIDTAVSLYNARVKLYNDRHAWLGPQTKLFTSLKELPVHEQILRQIIQINQEIEENISSLDEKNILRVNYKTIADHPGELLQRIHNKHAWLEPRETGWVLPELKTNPGDSGVSIRKEFEAVAGSINLNYTG